MTRLLLVIILTTSSILAQTTIHRDSRTSENSPIAATFTLRDSLHATLGDSRDQTFKPTLSLYDSAGGAITILLADSLRPYSPKECRVNSSDALWFPTDNTTRHLLYLRDDHSLEWEIILDSPTTRTTYRFPVKLQNLIAFYQPELSKEELAEGHSRPDSIVGSYAIYRKTGEKLLHIPRPRAFDADGNSVWCDLRIDSLFTLTIPSDFLDKARYPIRIDPSFGYSNAGASSLAVASIRCYANGNANYRYTAGANQRVDSFRVHLRTLTGNSDTVDVALYSYNNGIQNRLDTAVWVHTASANATWVSSGPIAQLLTNGTTYTLATNHHEGTPRISYDVGYSGDHSFDSVNDLPATWTEDGVGTYLISMQAWYSTIATSSTPTRRRRL